jgi:flagellar hook-associated protein 3 FlgL
MDRQVISMDTRMGMPAFFQNAFTSAQQIGNQLSALQAQATTGQKFAHVSDDPAAALTVLSNTDQNQRLTAHLSNIQTVTTALNASVSALQKATDIFSQAKSLAIQASSSTNDTTSFAALADQVDGLITSLVSVANTQNNGTYLFGGASAHTPPFAVTGQDALGNPQTVSYQASADGSSAIVDDSRKVEQYYPGSQVFGTQGGADAFNALIDLRNDLNNVNNLSQSDQIKAISSQIANLDSANAQVLKSIGQQSASLQSLTSLQSHLQDLQLSTKQTIANVGGADLTDVVVKLQSFEQQLQLSLEAFAQISSISLMNYLK